MSKENVTLMEEYKEVSDSTNNTLMELVYSNENIDIADRLKVNEAIGKQNQAIHGQLSAVKYENGFKDGAQVGAVGVVAAGLILAPFIVELYQQRKEIKDFFKNKFSKKPKRKRYSN